MNISLVEISKELNISSEELINRGLFAYLEREIRLAEEDIADIRDKYSVAKRSHLEKKIKDKEIHSHPAWEDIITWENLEAHIKKVEKTLERMNG